MTLLSTLAGGAAGAKYKSGVFYPAVHLNNNAGATITADRDYLVPFSPRNNVAVAEIAYRRVATTAGNVYVGIYDFAGNLLTDCAVDSNTTAGLHAVSTTPVTLKANEVYWFAVNASAAVVNGDTILGSDVEPQPYLYGRDSPGYYLDGGWDPTAASGILKVAGYKARSNAALSNPLTITGFTGDTFIPYIGIVPQ